MLLYNSLYIGTVYASLGFLATLVLAVCCALRLARFNLSTKSAEVTLKKDNHFVGVPAPALACRALLPIYMQLHGWQDTDLPYLAGDLHSWCWSRVPVSTIPTMSIKHASIRRAHLPFAVVAAMALVMCLVVYPWPTLIAGNLVYLASLPFSYLAHIKHIKALQNDHARFLD